MASSASLPFHLCHIDKAVVSSVLPKSTSLKYSPQITRTSHNLDDSVIYQIRLLKCFQSYFHFSIKGKTLLCYPLCHYAVCFSSQALKPSVKVYAAEPLNADDCYQSKMKGELTPNLHPPETIADGVRSSIGLNTWPIIRDLVDDVFTVTEDEIKVRLG